MQQNTKKYNRESSSYWSHVVVLATLVVYIIVRCNFSMDQVIAICQNSREKLHKTWLGH